MKWSATIFRTIAKVFTLTSNSVTIDSNREQISTVIFMPDSRCQLPLQYSCEKYDNSSSTLVVPMILKAKHGTYRYKTPQWMVSYIWRLLTYYLCFVLRTNCADNLSATLQKQIDPYFDCGQILCIEHIPHETQVYFLNISDIFVFQNVSLVRTTRLLWHSIMTFDFRS